MTLSERLDRAKRERLLAAGLLHSEAALKPEVDVDVTDGATYDFASDDIRIEVKSSGLHSVPSPGDRTRLAAAPTLVGERRADCPNCRRPGHVDMVDLVGHTVHMSCSTCATLWRTPRPAG